MMVETWVEDGILWIKGENSLFGVNADVAEKLATHPEIMTPLPDLLFSLPVVVEDKLARAAFRPSLVPRSCDRRTK